MDAVALRTLRRVQTSYSIIASLLGHAYQDLLEALFRLRPKLPMIFESELVEDRGA